jgi:hypothetical protein
LRVVDIAHNPVNEEENAAQILLDELRLGLATRVQLRVRQRGHGVAHSVLPHASASRCSKALASFAARFE